MEVFKDYAYYYNAFYKEKDYRKEAEQVDYLLKKYGGNVQSVINFGCGTGRHDLELTELGYRCAGIDMSKWMIKIAEDSSACAGKKIDFSVADIRKYDSAREYDAVISLFHVMSYQTTNQDILGAFQSARTCLDQGGILLFDIWYGPGVLSDNPQLRVKEVEDEKNRLIRIAKPVMHDKENIVDVCYEALVIDKHTSEVKTIQEVHNMRYFFRPELEYFLEQAGFKLECNLDCDTLEETGYHSWTSYFVAKAV